MNKNVKDGESVYAGILRDEIERLSLLLSLTSGERRKEIQKQLDLATMELYRALGM